MKFHPGLCLLLLYLFSSSLIYGQQNSPAYRADSDSANQYMATKNYSQALAGYKRSFAKGNTNLYDLYNAGCSSALTGNTNEAFDFLTRSIQQGYMEKPWMERDQDLITLQSDKRWAVLMDEFGKEQKAMGQLFSKIKDVPSDRLIPFRQNGLWGYVDAKTLKEVVKPLFKNLDFIGDCTWLSYKDRCRFMLNNKGEITSIEYPVREEDIQFELAEDPQEPQAVSGIQGFTMNSKHEAVSFSDKYNRSRPYYSNISKPFLIGEKYHAIIEKGDQKGIIDQEGNVLPGFNFIHKELMRNDKASEALNWFYFKDEKDKTGYISAKGETKLYGELPNDPFYTTEISGYGLQKSGNLTGVFDNIELKWVLKPEPITIKKIGATYHGDCRSIYALDRARLIKIYFLIEEGQNAYYIDTSKKMYKPK